MPVSPSANTTLKLAVTRTNSASLAEAKEHVLELFRDACRALPTIIDIYNLYDIISQSELRAMVAQQFHKHTGVTNPKVIDMLVFKGKEELSSIVDHAKQRHHLISQYVVGPEGMVQPNKLGISDHGESEFLKKFYISNNF